MKKFDDLFDEFFGKKPEDKNPAGNPIRDEIIKIIQSLSNFSQPSLNDGLSDRLGEPTNIEEGTKDGFHYQKLTWETPQGRIVKMIIDKAPDGPADIPTLEDELKVAIENEDYELAIKLRDKLNSASGNKI